MWLAFTVSGLVEPIVERSSITKMIRSPSEKTTPKTGYHSKMKSLTDWARMSGVCSAGTGFVSAARAESWNLATPELGVGEALGYAARA